MPEPSEAEDLYRVYRPEWVTVYTAHANTVEYDDVQTLCEAAERHWEVTYAGRVRPDDMRIIDGGQGRHALVRLQLRLPTLKGEFKTERLALLYAGEQGWPEAKVVARNGPADHDLRSYGVKKLRQS